MADAGTQGGLTPPASSSPLSEGSAPTLSSSIPAPSALLSSSSSSAPTLSTSPPPSSAPLAASIHEQEQDPALSASPTAPSAADTAHAASASAASGASGGGAAAATAAVSAPAPTTPAATLAPEVQGLLAQITCPHCGHALQDARTLPCLHAFCLPCLKSLAGDRHSLTCPLCRGEVSSASALALPPTFWAPIIAEAYLKATQPQKRVDACERPAVLRCVTCDDFLCEDCVELHKTHPRFVSHKKITLEQYDAPLPACERNVLCGEHPDKPLEVYCHDCRVAVCLSCAVFRHNGHRTNTLRKSIVGVKAAIEGHVDTTKRKLAVVNDALAGVAGTRTLVQQQQQAISQAIHTMLQPLRAALDEREKLLCSFAQAACGERLQALHTQEETLLFRQKMLDTALSFCERCMHYGGDAEVVSVTQPIIERLRQLEAVWVPAQTCCEPNVSLVVDEGAIAHFLESIDRIGAIENPELHIPRDPSLPADPDAGKPTKRNYAALRTPRLVLGVMGEGPGQFRNPFGVCARGNNSVVVCDFGNGRLQEVFSDGRPARVVASFAAGKAAVGVAAYGEQLLLVDAKHQLSLMRADGSIVWAVGSRGTGSSHLNCPYAVAVLPCGTIVVSDQNNHRLQRLDASGKFLGTLAAEIKLDHPRGLALDAEGNLVVVDHVKDRVVVMAATGAALHSRGTQGGERGQLNRPFDVAVDAWGNVLVADWGNSRVVVFAPTGEASHFPTPGKPQGLCVDAAGNVIVTLSEGQVILY